MTFFLPSLPSTAPTPNLSLPSSLCSNINLSGDWGGGCAQQQGAGRGAQFLEAPSERACARGQARVRPCTKGPACTWQASRCQQPAFVSPFMLINFCENLHVN